MKIARNISLDFIGDNHKDDYITFSGLSYKEAKLIEKSTDPDEFINLLKAKFMAGSIVDDETGQPVKLTKDQIEDLPVDVLLAVIERLIGTDENLTKTSKKV